jgi:ABC-type sugar transport system permease subunit
LIIFFSLFMATLLNRAFAGRALVRAIFFLPVIMATTAIQGPLEQIMAMMLGGVSSIPPEMMREAQGFNAASIAFMLSDFGMPVQVIEFIVDAIAQLHNVIRASGVQILIFLAALQSVPTSMYEVAQIEGATGYEIFFKITVPMVSPLILTNIVYTVVDTYARSNAVDISHLTAFTLQQFGRSSAMSMVSSAAVMLLLGFVVWLVSKRVFYQN